MPRLSTESQKQSRGHSFHTRTDVKKWREKNPKWTWKKGVGWGGIIKNWDKQEGKRIGWNKSRRISSDNKHKWTKHQLKGRQLDWNLFDSSSMLFTRGAGLRRTAGSKGQRPPRDPARPRRRPCRRRWVQSFRPLSQVTMGKLNAEKCCSRAGGSATSVGPSFAN